MLKTVHSVDLPHSVPAPLMFVGEWVAWNDALTEIVAHGRDVAKVRRAALEAGHPNAVLERVRRPAPFIGAL